MREPKPKQCPKCGAGTGNLTPSQNAQAYLCGSEVRGAPMSMTESITCVRNQVAHLQTIVDKLAVTADGVPVVCPMTVWVVYGSVIHEYRLSGYDHHGETWTVYFEGGGFSAGIDWSHVFSTREAAEAAKDAPSPSTHAPQKGTGNDTT